MDLVSWYAPTVTKFYYIIVFPYDPDSKFTEEDLHQLEAVGIPVMASLKKSSEQLAAVVGVESEDSDEILYNWISGEGCTHPSTWRSLYDVLQKLGHEELNEQIKEFLGCELL